MDETTNNDANMAPDAPATDAPATDAPATDAPAEGDTPTEAAPDAGTEEGDENTAM